jgi:ABC-type bacteriocin/lantibiotic exporter with double-glycine peptidase domain
MWNVQKPDAHLKATSIDQQLREVGFESYRFNGTLKELSKIGYPAIALMTDIKSKQKYHTIITNISNETISLLNSSGNSYLISSSQFEKNWSGVALIPWRNALHLSIPVDYRHDIEERNLLARLIKTTGIKIADNNQITSEQEVRNALKQFQSSQGIASEGIAGEHTLFLLYRHSTEFRQPTAVK